MPVIKWSDEFSVRHADMDRQHQQLFDYVNEFYDCHDRGGDNRTLLGIFDKVVKYAGSHFADEEALMERAGFEGVRRHKIIHQQLVKRVLELRAELVAGANPKIGVEIRQFLKHWLTAHIKGVDMNYAECVASDRAAKVA
ncbi:MAG: hemerythrin family protein [Ectothiorhodospiraceae bacterium]|nr:hemerythrin family protein [Chromatiales bacterium]MCP5155484.1 hemerythrin family protein [Ectothiorhodospiraceae bacterium]